MLSPDGEHWGNGIFPIATWETGCGVETHPFATSAIVLFQRSRASSEPAVCRSLAAISLRGGMRSFQVSKEMEASVCLAVSTLHSSISPASGSHRGNSQASLFSG